ncbi:MAG: SCO family protein [Arenicellales bacterium]|nr:SCO family protein [Arenicellales bacterium]
MKKSWHVPAIALTAATAIGLGAGLWWHEHSVQSANPYEHLGGDFTLTSAKGPVSLSDYRGRVVMLFFGYTTCPDVCPMDLAKISAVISQLPEREAQQVAGLFVSVDSERDTPQRAAEYAAFFHPQITGVSGSAEAVDAVARQYYVLHQKVEDAGSALGYTIDHSATTYLIGPGGKVRQLLPHDASVEEMAEAVDAVLAG